MYKDDIQETIKDIAKEKDYDGDKSHIALYQRALTRMVASVEKDQERDDEIEQLWSSGIVDLRLLSKQSESRSCTKPFKN